MTAVYVHMKKITPGIRRDLLNLHICEEDLNIILYFQCWKYIEK